MRSVQRWPRNGVVLLMVGTGLASPVAHATTVTGALPVSLTIVEAPCTVRSTEAPPSPRPTVNCPSGTAWRVDPATPATPAAAGAAAASPPSYDVTITW